MCSTIRHLPGAHCFGFLQTRHFWKARTNGSYQNLGLGHLVTPTQRSEGSKCAALSDPSRGPLFQFPASKAFLESPDQWLSRKPYFRSFGHTNTEIWRLQMCSTIRPLPGAHYFSFLQTRHFWKAATSGSPQNFIFGGGE